MKIPNWLAVYGDKSFRGKCPVESAEQMTFFNQLQKQHPDLYGIAFHPRNEGKRTVSQVQRQKAEGMRAGVSDIIIPARPAFVCELKRQDHTKSQWEPEQLPYLECCHNQGAFVCVALGWEAAMEALEVWNAARQIPSR